MNAMMKKTIRKIIELTLIGCGAIALFNYTHDNFIYAFINDKIAKHKNENYIEKILPDIVQAQEKRLGIKYPGMPKIIVLDSDFPDGGYDAVEDTLEIMVGHDAVYDSSIKQILDHELGHFYVDKLEERAGKKLQHDIAESIALYIENTMNGEKHSEKGILKESLMIKSLAKKHGLKNAIEYLLNAENHT
jgi:hypothetical protein